MKKLTLLLFAVLLLSCEQIENVISYFAELSANTTEGSTDTEFIFTVDTNDSGAVLYCDDEVLAWNRSEAGYTFDSGTHVIKVITNNRAMDELEIFVEDEPVEVIGDVVVDTIIEEVVIEPEPAMEEELVVEPEIMIEETEIEPIESIVEPQEPEAVVIVEPEPIIEEVEISIDPETVVEAELEEPEPVIIENIIEPEVIVEIPAETEPQTIENIEESEITEVIQPEIIVEENIEPVVIEEIIEPEIIIDEVEIIEENVIVEEEAEVLNYNNYITTDNKVYGITEDGYQEIEGISNLFKVGDKFFYTEGEKYFMILDGEITEVDELPEIPESDYVEFGVGKFSVTKFDYNGEELSKVFSDTEAVAYKQVDGACMMGRDLIYSVSEDLSIRVKGVYIWFADGNPRLIMESGRVW